LGPASRVALDEMLGDGNDKRIVHMAHFATTESLRAGLSLFTQVPRRGDLRSEEFSEVRRFYVLSFILLNRKDERRRCPNEKVVGVAQYAERRARGGGSRRGRQQLSVLRLLPAQDGDHPDILLTASANRAHDDSAHDDRGADSSAQKNYP
jgi:hypothetical protein